MPPPDPRTLESSPTEEARLGCDPELLALVMQVHRELTLAAQVRLVLPAVVGWTGGQLGAVLGPDENRRSWSPIARTLAADDPRLGALENVEPGRVRQRLTGTRHVHEGLGPLTEVLARWPGSPPARTLQLPLLGSDGSWGGLIVVGLEREPDPPALDRVRELLESIRPAVANALRVLAMRELVIKDDTAACFNRRHFESSLPDELSRAARFHAALSLIFLDMDNLKEVNNRYGHAMGSRTLLEVSRRVRSKIRRFDKLFRFGGDEFCIVLPETAWHGALEVAERVRDAISSRPFLVDELGDGTGCRMTASLGIASYPLHARDQRELIEQADRAMQKIKRGGKNSIGIAEIVGDEHER